MFDLIREISQTMRNNRLRTFLTGISVAWGIFMLIVLLGAARGLVNSFEYRLSSRTLNNIQVWGGRTSQPYGGYQTGRRIRLRGNDRGALLRDNPDVSNVTFNASGDTVRIYGPSDDLRGFSAVYPGYFSKDGGHIAHGRDINDRDIAELRRTILLQDDKAALLFGSGEKAVGKEVRAMDLSWTVVGTYSHQWQTRSYVPYTTFKALTGGDDEVREMVVTVEGMKTEEDAEKAEEGIRKTLSRTRGFDPADQNAVWTWNRFADYVRNKQGGTYLNIAVWVIGILTLLTGIVGVSNIMFVSVRERTHEIGIRRAIGAKPRSIVTQVLAESVAITAAFGYSGIVAGMAVLQVVNHFLGDRNDAFRNPTVDISIAVEVTVALIVAGALAGLFPALKAVKVKPVEALRDE